jgi:hypothetical protein
LRRALARSTHAKEPAAAAALVRFLTSSKAALVMKKRGMEPGALLASGTRSGAARDYRKAMH